jgi:hypothetical protein
MPTLPSNIVRDTEIVILGICRNVSTQLEADVKRLLCSFQDFSKVHFRFVESDSTDSTLDMLRSLAASVPNFKYVTLGNLREQIQERVARICYCRNVCLDILRDDPLLKHCSFVAVSDLDGVNTLLTRDAVLSCWKRDDWDACMANQAAPYYDIYALRHPDWSPNDCWHYESELRSKGMNPLSARQKAIYSRMITINPQSEWIPVESAFGGLAIYKRNLFENARYSSTLPNGDHVCEHVTLHQQMRARGARLYINPQLINLGWNTHSESKKINKRFNRVIKLVLWKSLPPLRRKLF